MRIPPNSTLMIAAFAAAVACASEPTSPSLATPLGADFTLVPGERAIVGALGLSITFVRVVSEERCPTNSEVQCVWEGTANLQLRVTDATGTRDVPIETQSRASTATVDGYVIRLLALLPGRTLGAATPPERYRATFRVLRAD